MFGTDCAEHVLPLYEAVYPEDSRLRDCIAATRAFVKDEIGEKGLASARLAAMVAAWEAASVFWAKDNAEAADKDWAVVAAVEAIWAVVAASGVARAGADEAADLAKTYAADAAEKSSYTSDTTDAAEAREEEHLWQLAKILEYFP